MTDPPGISGSMRLRYMRQRLHVDIMLSHRVLVPDRVSHTNTVSFSSRYGLELFHRRIRNLA